MVLGLGGLDLYSLCWLQEDTETLYSVMPEGQGTKHEMDNTRYWSRLGSPTTYLTFMGSIQSWSLLDRPVGFEEVTAG